MTLNSKTAAFTSVDSAAIGLDLRRLHLYWPCIYTDTTHPYRCFDVDLYGLLGMNGNRCHF